MSDLPTCVLIHEEGPREGFQIEPAPISTADKIKLIKAHTETGLRHSIDESYRWNCLAARYDIIELDCWPV